MAMQVSYRRWHRLAGWVMVLPFIAWSLTGIFFLIRPAYEAAYAPLLVKAYPQTQELQLPVADAWLEYRFLESILGPHLLVRTTSGWRHLASDTGADYKVPEREILQLLVDDAVAANRQRYGQIVGGEDLVFLTDTGVEIVVDWNNLALRQRGRDTYWINQIYDIHYLRWTGIDGLDEFVGVGGLILLILMTITGIRLLLKPRLN